MQRTSWDVFHWVPYLCQPMAIIKKLGDKAPQLDDSCFLAENAVLTGDVKLGKDCGIWYHAVLRGDVGPIIIGDRTNIQDAAIVHTSTGRSPAVIGNDVTVGHRAIVHGCTVKDRVLVGMGAIILDDAVIGEGSIIAAGAVVLENTIVEPGSLMAGVPAKKVRDVSDEAKQAILESAAHYVENAKAYSAS